jgi:curli biogenesis system outer membrane secretion channel CsgG
VRVILLLSVVLIQGCAFTTARLNVAARPNTDFKGPISQVAPTKFDVQALADERSDKARIGWKKNGYGSNTADILSTRPVTDLVAEAIRTGLQQNGHSISLPADIVVSGSVTRFWFEVKPNFWTIEFTGNVECDLRFVRSGTSQEVYKSRYSGTYTRKTGGGLEATWTEVMDASLEKLVEDIVFDANLIEALNSPK